MKDYARMIEWLLMAAVLYAACILLRNLDVAPQAQVVLWKLGNVTLAAYAGYWIDRRAFSRIAGIVTVSEQLRRAVVMAAAMIAVSMGL
jgi:hypothetical protein